MSLPLSKDRKFARAIGQLNSGAPRYTTVIAIGVLASHVLMGLLIAQFSAVAPLAQLPSQQLTLIVLDHVLRAPPSLSLRMTAVPSSRVAPDLPVIATFEEKSGGGASKRADGKTIPPHPDAMKPVDVRSFARQAGISAHSGVTVVLRVEVQGSGAVRRVDVDVSGGSTRIDQAAIAYTRGLKWIGGRVDDEPKTLWIRWGVRLDG